MLNELWILVSGLLVLIALLTSQGLLLVVGSLVVLIWLTIKIWDRYAFRRVRHARSLNRHRAFIGDTLEYSVSLSNDKLLPMIWVDIHDTFPEGLELSGANLRTNSIAGTRQHTITTSLLPFQQVTWKYNLKCASRGFYRIGPVRVQSGDIFGFSMGEARFEETEHLLVYPRVVELEQLDLPSENPLGEGRGMRPLFPDNSRIAGQREYQSTDPMKHIDWKATARSFRLQTKIFEPVIALNVLVALNATTSEQPWESSNRRLFERGVTVAASVASYAARRGYSFGLVSNAVATFTARYISVPLGASPSQISLVLEALATAGPFAVTTLPGVLKHERSSLPPGSTVVLVTSIVSESIINEVREMKEQGYRVLVLYAGDGQPEADLPGVRIYFVGDLLDELPDTSSDFSPDVTRDFSPDFRLTP